MKNTIINTNLNLDTAWEKRENLRGESKKVLAKSNKLFKEWECVHRDVGKIKEQRHECYIEANKKYAEGNKRYQGSQVQYISKKTCYAEDIKLIAEGDICYAEAQKIEEVLCKVIVKYDLIHAHATRLKSDSRKIMAEADIDWVQAILKVHGNIKINWKYVEELKDFNCILQNGHTYLTKVSGPS